MYFQNISVNPVISKIYFFLMSQFGTLYNVNNRGTWIFSTCYSNFLLVDLILVVAYRCSLRFFVLGRPMWHRLQWHIELFGYSTCVCSWSNPLSDWLTVGHYFPMMPTVWLGQNQKTYNTPLCNLKVLFLREISHFSTLLYWSLYHLVYSIQLGLHLRFSGKEQIFEVNKQSLLSSLVAK